MLAREAGSLPTEPLDRPASRLRQILRSGQARQPCGNPPAVQRCEIICKWVSGNINPRYQFRAIVPGRSARTVIVERSPVFQSDDIPVPPSEQACAALEALIETLASEGWEQIPDAKPKHWYSRSFQRRTPATSNE